VQAALHVEQEPTQLVLGGIAEAFVEGVDLVDVDAGR
jgi:hypothetical protein